MMFIMTCGHTLFATDAWRKMVHILWTTFLNDYSWNETFFKHMMAQFIDAYNLYQPSITHKISFWIIFCNVTLTVYQIFKINLFTSINNSSLQSYHDNLSNLQSTGHNGSHDEYYYWSQYISPTPHRDSYLPWVDRKSNMNLARKIDMIHRIYGWVWGNR